MYIHFLSGYKANDEIPLSFIDKDESHPPAQT